MAQPHKKARLEHNRPSTAARPDARPTLATLVAASAGLPSSPSPGAMHGCRIVSLSQPSGSTCCSSFFASANRVYYSCLETPAGLKMEEGKEGVVIAVRLTAPPAQLIEPLVHRYEVQSLSVVETGTELRLATVDSTGQGVLARLQVQNPAGDSSGSSGGSVLGCSHVHVQQMEPLTQANLGEAGWAGVVLCPWAPEAAAVARCFARDVVLYDGARAVRSFNTLQQPFSVMFLGQELAGGAGHLLSVTEGHLVTIYDARAGEGGGVVQHITTAATPGQPLYCQDWCSGWGDGSGGSAGGASGLLGVAGAERSVVVLEPRKWRSISKWVGAARQSVHHMAFLSSAPSYCCVSGLDHEVLCARWEQAHSSNAAAPPAHWKGRAEGPMPAQDAAAPPEPGRKPSGVGAEAAAAADTDAAEGASAGPASTRAGLGFMFRGDSRWLGVAKARGQDMLAGIGASGNVFYGKVAAAVAAA